MHQLQGAQNWSLDTSLSGNISVIVIKHRGQAKCPGAIQDTVIKFRMK